MRAYILVCLLTLLLAGCGGGSSGANGSDPFNGTGDPVIVLTIAILDSNCAAVEENTFTADQSICVQATLSTDDSAFSGQVINFAMDTAIGTLSDGTALTDSAGVAQVVISNDAETTGAATITATYNTSNTASDSFQYTPADNTGSDPTPTISVEMIVDGTVDNRFRVGENVALRSTVLDADGVPVADEIVSFLVPSSAITISPSDSLTDNTGTTRATMSGTDAGIGAHVLTASVTLAGTEFTATQNIELLAAVIGQDERALTLEVLDENCTNEDRSFSTNETICILVTLSQGENPIQNEIVSFSIESTLGELSMETVLTNSDGQARTFISNTDGTVGATSVIAAFDTLSESQNYEYVAIEDTIINSPTMSVEIISTGNSVNGFQAGEDVVARSTLRDTNGNAVSGAIVTFAIQGTGPLLTPTTALTNNVGIAEVEISATETDLGAYALQVQATVDSVQISNSTNFEVRSAGAVVDSQIRFGHITSNGDFVEGQIGSNIADANGDVTISAGATTGFNVALVDENDARIANPTPVTFTSTCVVNSQATIDESISTINGVASATFEDISCAGATGNSDQIVASVVINNSTLTIVKDITILPESVGSVSFVSATPESIVLSGTGGQGNSSVSTLLFQVNGALGNPLAQQEVSFQLNTTAGGLTLAPAEGLTNSQGQVSTRVTAGSVPTPVRVSASVQGLGGEIAQTQSDLLSVSTGLPDQNSFTLSASTLNPEAFNVSGQEVTIRVRLADSFNNPVPNGTTVNFTTESGIITDACRTGADILGFIDPDAANNGTCSVTWTSASPRTNDHRTTILAYAIGHETLFDANGNNAYDDTDGGPILDGTDSGFSVSNYGQTGFVDLSEAWRDDDEDDIRDESEIFIPFNGNGSFDLADGLFNGPQCNSETLCDSDAASIHIRRSLVLVTSSSEALYRLYADNPNDTIATFDSANIFASNDINVTANDSLTDSSGRYELAEGSSVVIYIVYYDTAEQVLANGTSLGTINTNGILTQVLDSVNNTTQREDPEVPGNVYRISTTFQNTAGVIESVESRSLVIDSPLGTRTSVEFSISFL